MPADLRLRRRVEAWENAIYQIVALEKELHQAQQQIRAEFKYLTGRAPRLHLQVIEGGGSRRTKRRAELTLVVGGDNA